METTIIITPTFNWTKGLTLVGTKVEKKATIQDIEAKMYASQELTTKVIFAIREYVQPLLGTSVPMTWQQEWAIDLLKQYLAEKNQRHLVANGWKAKYVIEAVITVEQWAAKYPRINSVTRFEVKQGHPTKETKAEVKPWAERVINPSDTLDQWAAEFSYGNVDTSSMGKKKNQSGKKDKSNKNNR